MMRHSWRHRQSVIALTANRISTAAAAAAAEQRHIASEQAMKNVVQRTVAPVARVPKLRRRQQPTMSCSFVADLVSRRRLNITLDTGYGCIPRRRPAGLPAVPRIA